MLNYFSDRLRTRAQRRGLDQGGFTLVELLVVITILGILAAVVVFSVAGLGDKGQTTAFKTDQSILKTAEEAYFAKFGHYGTMQELKDAGLIEGLSTLNPYVLLFDKDGSGPLGPTSDYAFGDPAFAFSPANPVAGDGKADFLAASNMQTSARYIASNYMAGHPTADFSILFGATGTLATTAQANPGSTADENVLFFSADRVTAETVATANAAPGETAVPYTRGQLAIISCNGSTPLVISGVATTTCAPSPELTAALADSACGVTNTQANFTAADVVTLLTDADCQSHGVKVTVADPGAGCGTTAATAPYGCAGRQALESAGLATFDALHTGGVIVYGAGNNVSVSLNNLRSGAADVAFTPGSYVYSPLGNEKNPFNLVTSGYDPIMQYAVVLNHGTAAMKEEAKDFLAYVRSSAGQAMLAEFGYLPL